MEKEKQEVKLPKPTLIEDLGMIFATENSKRKYRKRRASETHKTHGLRSTRLYVIWANIKDRTLNINTKAYTDYGGRGITICDEWKNDFMSFYNWAMSNDYEENKGLSIDRIDNDGDYSPENCRWTTQTIQNRNQRIQKNNTSGYKGVCYYKRYGNYLAQIMVNKKKINLGYFQTAVEAGIAYNNYIIENNLEGFILNEIPEKV